MFKINGIYITAKRNQYPWTLIANHPPFSSVIGIGFELPSGAGAGVAHQRAVHDGTVAKLEKVRRSENSILLAFILIII
jgi:hypothetical protein